MTPQEKAAARKFARDVGIAEKMAPAKPVKAVIKKKAGEAKPLASITTPKTSTKKD